MDIAEPSDKTHAHVCADMHGKNANQQLSSPFFRLPLEIRREIYKLVVVIEADEGYVPLVDIEGVLFRLGRRNIPVDGIRQYKYRLLTKCKKSRDNWRLARTCKRMYNETIEYLYTNRAFKFTDAACFLQFIRQVPTYHATLIGYLRLNTFDWDWWCRDNVDPKKFPQFETNTNGLKQQALGVMISDRFLVELRDLLRSFQGLREVQLEIDSDQELYESWFDRNKQPSLKAVYSNNLKESNRSGSWKFSIDWFGDDEEGEDMEK